MSFKRDMSNFNRVNLDTKTDRQAREILVKHYNNLKMDIPSRVVEGGLTSRELKKMKKEILKGYSKEVKKEDRVNKAYNTIKNKYNKKIDKNMNKVLKGRTELEQRYIKGEQVFIPKLMIPSFQTDQYLLRKIGNEEFSSLQAKQERTQQLKKDYKKLDNITNKQLYNTRANLDVIKFMIEGIKFHHQMSSTHFNMIYQMIRTSTEFEFELFTKMQLYRIIEKYLGVEYDSSVEDLGSYFGRGKDLDEEGAEKMFAKIVEGFELVQSENRVF